MLRDTPQGGAIARRWIRNALLGAVALGLISFIATGIAGNERFDYDELGRLVRVIDEQNRVTEYVYDPAGNLLRVITNGSVQAPVVTGITPDTLRRGETRQIQITGTGLNNVRVTSADPELVISDARVSPTQVSFTLTANDNTIVGPQPITLTNASGATTAAITVLPRLPRVSAAPIPLAVPPDNTARQFTIRLSNADYINHTFTISTSDPLVVTVSPSTMTILAGQTEAQVNVTGIAGGIATISITSPTLGTTLVPVYVTTEFRGISTSYAPPLGVVVQEAPKPPTTTTITPFGAPHLGVVVGGYIGGISPKAVAIGSAQTNVTITGRGLVGVTSVSVVPPDGITLGALAVNSDGTSVTVPVTVAANASTTLRQVVLTAGTQIIPSALPNADRLQVSYPAPEVTSVDPQYAVPGTPAQTITVRGRYFQNLESIAITPSTGLVIGAAPAVSADGTEISLRVAISPIAPVGPRVVIVNTAGGGSDVAVLPSNTFTIVNELQQTYSPISAPLVGVVVEQTPPPVSQTLGVFTTPLGVSVGAVITGISPPAGSIGESLALTVNGYDLQNVTAIEFLPSTGITVGTLAVAPDSRSLTVPITLAADAPQTLRTIQVKAGTAVLPSAPAGATQFLVTTPLPFISSVTPIYLQTGQTATALTVRGRNFQNIQAVKVLPPDGITISPPTVNSSSTEATVNISAAANAALGPRVVVVETAAGATSNVSTVENTITLTNSAGSTYTPVVASLLGVVLQETPQPVSTVFGPIASANLGVVLEEVAPPPASQTFFSPSALVGVSLGPVATMLSPAGFAPGVTGTVTVQGYALNDVTAVNASPATGITFGTPQVSADGASLSVPITVAADAPAGPREIRLVTAAAGNVPFSSAAANHIIIATGVPNIDSITPILAAQGTAVTMTIRGQNFQYTSAVSATPADGLLFVPNTLTVNSAGTGLSVQIVVAADAPLGVRVIRVTTPGGTTTDVALPANSFTVNPP